MPDKTADALERILSLGQEKRGGPPAGGPAEQQYAGPGPAFVAGADLLSSMFFEVTDEAPEAAAGSRPRFDSAMSWTAEYNDHDHVLEASAANAAADAAADAAAANAAAAAAANAAAAAANEGEDEWYAHGPNTYGAPHVDPYGPADKDEPGPPGPPSNDFSPGSSPAMWGSQGWGSTTSGPSPVSHDAHRDGAAAGGPRDEPCLPHAAQFMGEGAFEAGAPAQRPQECGQQQGLSQFVPQWAYETLPRDCLIMLLESALKRMPQEADVVARCMRALAPLSREEYEQCFGSLSSEAPERGPLPSQGASAGASSRPAVDIPVRASVGNTGWERTAAHHANCAAPGIKLERPCSPPHAAGSGKRSFSPEQDLERARGTSLGAAQVVSSGAGEVKRTINKAGARSSIRLTDSRVGMRTSILTEEQAIEVFKQRPAQRTERAGLCSVLADRYSVTTTAIRHIWDRRTWVWTNIPYWTPAELAASLAEGTCDTCREKKVDRIEDTCEHCPINRKRGRPRGARDTYRRQRKNP